MPSRKAAAALLVVVGLLPHAFAFAFAPAVQPHRQPRHRVVVASGSVQQAATSSGWLQKTLTVTPPKRGCHIITNDVVQALSPELRAFKCGLAHIFVQHTSCSLTINENCDPTVRSDMERALNLMVPESWNHDGTFYHTDEGDDDMPAHVKSSMFGASITVPISNGGLALGTWQGIYLCEHRNYGGPRKLVITVQGEQVEMVASEYDPSLTRPKV